MKKLVGLLVGLLMVLGVVGNASAVPYYESYEGSQYISQSSPDYWFHFDIDLAGNGWTNSNLAFTNDASGFDLVKDDQLSSVQIAIDLYSRDRRPELFDMYVDIYWSNVNFTETVSFNATYINSTYYYTYDFTPAQIDAWEIGGFGNILIDAYDIVGPVNYNEFYIKRVAVTAEPVPEPATMLLFGIGLLGLAGVSRKKK